MEITKLSIPGILLISPRHIGDDRGYFAETFRADIFARYCSDVNFVQDNESRSARAGTIRGFHFQSEPRSQGKLVRCTAGSLLDVAVDIRTDSPTYGEWVGETLSSENGKQLWIPPGFAHGFCSLEPDTVICYKVTDYYSAENDRGLSWDDPDIGVIWPRVADASTLSSKDLKQPLLRELPNYFQMERSSSCA